MILLLFAGVLILQLIAYTLLDRKGSRYGKILILLVILIVYGFVLPRCFLPTPPESGEPQCGMPVLGIYGAFWVFGGGITLSTHLVYWAIRQITDR